MNMKVLDNIRNATEEDRGLIIPSAGVVEVEYYLRVIQAACNTGWKDVDLYELSAEVDYLLSLPEDPELQDIEDLGIVKDEAIGWMNDCLPRGLRFRDTEKGLVLIRYHALKQEESYDEPEL
jgi:hypothetical protein